MTSTSGSGGKVDEHPSAIAGAASFASRTFMLRLPTSGVERTRPETTELAGDRERAHGSSAAPYIAKHVFVALLQLSFAGQSWSEAHALPTQLALVSKHADVAESQFWPLGQS
jgi:hypothetical protein